MKMVNYPNGKAHTSTNAPASKHGHLSAEERKLSAANRGMSLEEDINQTNQHYLDIDRANIHKKPTPIQIVKVDYPRRSAAKIVEAYFKTPSTTDYNGVYKGRAIDFEAKECGINTAFPFSSIHPHQVKHLKSVIRHGAIAFVIVRFTGRNETYYVPAQKIIDLYEKMERKSIPYPWFQENGIIIPFNLIKPVDYLTVIDSLFFTSED